MEGGFLRGRMILVHPCSSGRLGLRAWLRKLAMAMEPLRMIKHLHGAIDASINTATAGAPSFE